MPTSFYLRSRFAAPDETVTVVDQTPAGLIVVRNAEGREWVVGRAELSAVPADELYRSLQQRVESRFKIPVQPVRFAASA